ALGHGIVQKLIEKGSRVVVLDKNEQKLVALFSSHPQVTARVCDLTHPDEILRVMDSVFSEVGCIHGLVNNAGMIKNSTLVNVLAKGDKKHSIPLWQEVLTLNLSSAFYLTTHVVEKMLSTRTPGVIINIASIAANGNAGQTAYAAAKGGLIAMTKTWAKELGPMGIRCVAVSPGFIDTPSTRSALSQNTLDHLTQSTPLRRLGTVEEVATAVIFALENDFYTGKVLEIDGGLVL
ncbi:MAG: SDR family oxidoreductase, partial [Gammaproteobacteria bacterium]|nr:SDR family oxidoreductase [Gammaproteobacteria bacterium]